MWTEGATCAQGCGGGGQQCATTCDQASAIQLNQIYSCDLQGGRGAANWFRVGITTGTFRFEVATAQGNDYDVYTFSPCGSGPRMSKRSDRFDGRLHLRLHRLGDLFIAVAIWDGGGPFDFRVTQVGITDQPGSIALK
ncbi:MAG: hypothetical protein IPH10_13575 [bacterium]|nr:hypothetical protein [bacterium]